MNNFCKILIIILASCCQLRANGFDVILGYIEENSSFEIKYDNYSDLHNINIGVGWQENIIRIKNPIINSVDDVRNKLEGSAYRYKLPFFNFTNNLSKSNNISSLGGSLLDFEGRTINHDWNFTIGLNFLSLNEDLNKREFEKVGGSIGISHDFLTKMDKNIYISLNLNCALKELTPKFDIFPKLRDAMKSFKGIELLPEIKGSFKFYPISFDYKLSRGLYFINNSDDIKISSAGLSLNFQDMFFRYRPVLSENSSLGKSNYDVSFQINYLSLKLKDISEESMSFSIVFRYYYNYKPYIFE